MENEVRCPNCGVEALATDGEYVCPHCGLVLGPVYVYPSTTVATPTQVQLVRLKEEFARKQSKIRPPKKSVTEKIVQELWKYPAQLRDPALKLLEEVKSDRKLWLKVQTHKPRYVAAALVYLIAKKHYKRYLPAHYVKHYGKITTLRSVRPLARFLLHVLQPKGAP